MAIGWMTILSNVPWTEVIKNAPAVADGAKKLWKKVGGKASTGEGDVVLTPNASPADPLSSLRAQVDELQGQMLASSELIRSLAEQNAELIARVEKTRRRLLLLVVVNAIALPTLFVLWLSR